VLFVADYADRLLLGRLEGPETVGLYGQAKNLMIKPVYLVTTPLAAIVLSGLARAVDQPTERIDLARAFYRILAILLMPVCVGLAVVGQDVMPVLGGQDWQAAGPLLAALAVGLFAQAVLIINGWVLAGVGRTDRLFASAIGVLVVQLLGYSAGWAIGRQRDSGALGMAWGYAVAVLVVLVVPHTWFTLRTALLPPGPIARAIRRSLIASLVMGAAVWVLRQQIGSAFGDRPGMMLAVEVAAGVSLYLVLAREEIQWLRVQWATARTR
jgi:PST family polysaccharide transporter